MFDASVWRIAWKEYRTQRPLWLAIVVLTLLVQLGYQIAVTIGGTNVSEQALYVMAMGAAAVYALGCGATLFAAERETGTFEFQRGLPLAWRPLFVGKAGFGAASVVALAIVLWGVTIAMAGGRLPSWRDSGELWGGGLLAAWEVFAWSLLFSLVLDRPLIAALLGVLVPSVFVHVAAPAVVGFDYHSVGLRHYLAIVPWRLGIALAVSATDIWLASRWLCESGRIDDSDADTSDDAAAGGATHGSLAARTSVAVKPLRHSGFWRLVWQDWYQARWTIVWISVAYVSAIVLSIQSVSPKEWNAIPLGLLVPAAALWGLAVFVADQRRQAYRYFAEHGMNPRLVWLSRQVVGAAPLVAWLVAALFFSALCPQSESGRIRWPPPNMDARFAGEAVCCALLAYAAGQACSMFFRSAILALVGTVFSVIVLVYWVVLMHAAEISWSWSVLPIPVVLLAATWRRAPDWVLERTSWPARWRLGSTLAIPAAVLVTAVILVRIYEIPWVEPGFDVEEFLKPPTAEQLDTLQLYTRAEASFHPMRRDTKSAAAGAGAGDEMATEPTLEEKRRWVAENQEAIDLLLEARRRPPCGIWDPVKGQVRLSWHLSLLGDLLLASAATLVADGKLDEGWERHVAALRMVSEFRTRGRGAYLRGDAIEQQVCGQLPQWADHPQQTPGRIRAAIRELETYSHDVPSVTSMIKDAYVEAVRPLEGDFRRWECYDPRSVRIERLAYALLPWETARARRLASYFTASNLDRIQCLEQSLASEATTAVPRTASSSQGDPRLESAQYSAWMDTTPLAPRVAWIHHGFWLDQALGAGDVPPSGARATGAVGVAARARAVPADTRCLGWPVLRPLAVGSVLRPPLPLRTEGLAARCPLGAVGCLQSIRRGPASRRNGNCRPSRLSVSLESGRCSWPRFSIRRTADNADAGECPSLLRLHLPARSEDRDPSFPVSTDAVLVALCERLDAKHVATVDRDFEIYRYRGREKFINVLFE